VAVDIFRVKDGKVAEHWDVMQEEVPASATGSLELQTGIARGSHATTWSGMMAGLLSYL